MNNFTPDQNPHILSNSERGSGGNNTNEVGEGDKKKEGLEIKEKEELGKKKDPTTTIPVAEVSIKSVPQTKTHIY